MPVFSPYSQFRATLGRFFGNYFFWAIKPAQKLHGTLDPPTAHVLGSGPVGDDDLWYHHILGTLRSVFFLHPPSQPAS